MIGIPHPGPLSAFLTAALNRLSETLTSLSGQPVSASAEPLEVIGDPDVLVSSLAAAAEAEPGALCFAVGNKYLEMARAKGAAAIIVPPDLAAQEKGAPEKDAQEKGAPEKDQAKKPGPTLVVFREPRLLFAVVLGLAGDSFIPSFGEGQPYFKDKNSVSIGQGVTFGPFSYVGAGVTLGKNVVVGPRVFIEDSVAVGDDTILHPGAVLRWGVKIGRGCQIHSGAVIGEDGFGYNQVPLPPLGRLIHFKNPHLGSVVIEDDVEVGALAAIDRGLVGDTVIGRGTKIDNLVQIGHNCQVGRDCVIVAQVGLGGHSVIGDRAFLLGQVGLTHGSVIGEDAILAGQAGVLKRVPAGRGVWTGTPAQPQATEYRSQLLVRNDLPKWRRFFGLFKKGKSYGEIQEVMLAEEKEAPKPVK
ncbi:MAG: UDP-3-O-(3-hydroxymyristoyl)glucosamine N-acyltransferase [Deltaproteobacteria bacterium]|jgi:UDP-3-O-[3-hydroxymyristoyl] glucosamine N-acyltransferase|nr:UDP-3-O-(3-hydroxymyristoyl)glucosamine N-acyltransferase [Deltaproteobacteria bacterium]